MKVIRGSFVAAMMVAWLLSVGCGDGGPPRHALRGTVTVDGRPVPFGWMVFSPREGPAASANIENGEYSTPPGFGAIGGVHTIELIAYHSQPPSDDSQPAPAVTRYLVERDVPVDEDLWNLEFTSADAAPAG